MKKCLNVFVLAFLCVSMTYGANISWNGSVDNDWHNDANWIGGTKPGMGDYAIINGGSFIANISTTEIILGVRVINATLNITSTGDLTCNGSTPGFPAIYGQGNVTNDGMISVTNVSGQPGIHMVSTIFMNNGVLDVSTIDRAGVKTSFGATFTNNGSVTVDDCTGITGHGIEIFSSNDMFTNNSIVDIGSVTTVGARGIFNAGSFVNNSGADVTIYNSVHNALDITSNATFNNAGEITVANGSSSGLAINCTGVLTNSGKINGTGVISGSAANFVNLGIVSPGNSPGTQTYSGGFTNSTYNAELASSSNDMLIFTGGASSDFVIGGTLDIILLEGTPASNQSFVIVDSPVGYTGTFSTINYPTDDAEWEIEYNANDITITYLGIILPIKLSDFKAESNENGIELLWSTDFELNNEGFELQRSIDGELWSKIGWIPGERKMSTTVNKYEFQDQFPVIGTNYYKLVQCDLDGGREEHNIITADFGGVNFELIVYPNPAHETINIKTSTGVSTVINIYNNTSKLVLRKESNVTEIDISQLVSGEYWLEVYVGTQRSIRTFVKR